MARASQITQLSLDRFFQILGMNPLHSNQVGIPSEVNTCGQPIFQYSWQTADRTSREEIAMAIFDAERLLAQYAMYDIGLRWNANEEHYLARGYGTLRTNRKFLVSGGQQASTLRSAGVPITYSDVDSDGYFETATITYNNTVDIEEDEVAIFYPGEGEEWRIRPITTTVVHSAPYPVVITCRREQLVKPEKMEIIDVVELIGTDDSNFLTTVDVWRIYNDDTKQVEFISTNYPDCVSNCDENITDGCLTIVDHRLGVIGLRHINYDCLVWPFKVRLWYRAGLTRDIEQWERATAYLALSLLDRPICGCPSLEHVSRKWQEDLGAIFTNNGKSSSYKLSRRLIDNPFGATRAGIFAWNLVERQAVYA